MGDREAVLSVVRSLRERIWNSVKVIDMGSPTARGASGLHSRKPRLAWVAPAPPAETGVSDYALEVAETLSTRFELEWILDPRGPAPTSEVARRFRVISADDFDERHAERPFDLPVYHLGNNHFHVYMLSLMRRHPGLVVAHDTHTGGLFTRAQEAGVWPESWQGELEANGEWLLADWVNRGVVHPHATPTLVGFNRRVFESAAGILVHSCYGWQQVRRACDVPVAVVPHIARVSPPVDRVAERQRLGLPTDEFIVCSLGIVSPPKRSNVIVRATAALPAELRRRTRVLLVGPCEESAREQLEQLAASRHVRLELRGRVDLADFAAYAAAADVCVQLRYPLNGETSGALTRALAAGATCVVSDTGAMAELPNNVALKVRSPAQDVDDLTAALRRLADDPRLVASLGENARRYIAETCSAESVVPRYAALIADSMRAVKANDGRWRTAMTNALAEWAGDPPSGLIEEWAKLREAALRAKPASNRRAA